MIAKIAFAGFVFAMGAAALAAPASAKVFDHVSVKQVVSACDKNPSCGYTVNDNGVLSGCAVNSGACFNCKGSECTVTTPLQGGHKGPLGLISNRITVTMVDPGFGGGKGGNSGPASPAGQPSNIKVSVGTLK